MCRDRDLLHGLIFPSSNCDNIFTFLCVASLSFFLKWMDIEIDIISISGMFVVVVGRPDNIYFMVKLDEL